MIPSSLSTQFLNTSNSRPLSIWDRALLGMFSVCRLKKRHIFTRNDRIRLRYIASTVAGVSLAIGFFAFGDINPAQEEIDGMELISQIEPAAGATEMSPFLSYVMGSKNVAQNILSASLLDNHRDKNGQIRRDPSVKESVFLAENSNASNSPGAEELRIEISKGDTLVNVLTKSGLENGEAQSVVNAISRHFSMKALRPGQVFNLTLEPADTKTGYQLASLNFAPDALQTIEVSRGEDGELSSELNKKAVTPSREARKVVINGSVYGSADKANLPDRVTANTIKLFSYAVDFQRDVREGDTLDVLYDSYKTKDGHVARTGDIVYARLNVGGREYALYRYETQNGTVDYYTANGKSIRKSAGLMRTPVAFGRMSSGFGVRTHPVLGYTKMHKGVDFAAPTGTAVYASADGVIERAGRFSSFGNYVRIRHSSKMSTAYAHLSRYGKGIRPGVRVKQGQIIGYVGTTGRSTGPHLHYEVLVNNVQVNPRSVKFATDNSLSGKELARFKQKVRAMGQEYTEKLNQSVKLASAE